MPVAQLLFSLLATGAALVASSAVSEFAKGAGKAAFEALKKRLASKHDVKSLPLLEEAAKNPAFAEAVKVELEKPEVTNDAEVLRLAGILREAISVLPPKAQARYAVDIEEIRSGATLLFDAVEGVKAKSAIAEGDMTVKTVTAPPGKH